MKRLLAAAMLASLALGAGVARAEEVAGKIQSVDVADRAIVLEDGSRIWVAEGIAMDNLVQGKNVKAAYEEREGKKVATSVEVSED
jgi:hypothetical protein